MFPGDQVDPRPVHLASRMRSFIQRLKQTNKNTEGEGYYCFFKNKTLTRKNVELLGNDFINEIYRETFNGTKIVRLFKNQIVFKHTIFNTMRFYFVKKNQCNGVSKSGIRRYFQG